jgi:hypothetical protein
LSHTVAIRTEMKDEAALRAACKELGYPEPQQGVHKLYGHQTATGLGVMVPGWHYPLVINTQTGEIKSEYGFEQEAAEQIKKLTQMYGAQKAMQLYRAKGKRVQMIREQEKIRVRVYA